MITNKKEGSGFLMGIITFFIVFVIGAFSVDIFHYDTITLAMGSIFIAVIVGYRVDKHGKKETESNPIPQRIKDVENYNQKFNIERSIYNVKYVQGHHQYTQPIIANIGLGEDEVIFYTLELVDDAVWSASRISKVFSIKYSKIMDAVYDTSEKVTMARFIAFGLGSFVFKKKTHYLVIRYIENNVENSLIFETGNIKNQEFYNLLNVKRNTFARHREEDENSTPEFEERINKLNKLRESNLITQEEWETKRQELLELL